MFNQTERAWRHVPASQSSWEQGSVQGAIVLGPSPFGAPTHPAGRPVPCCLLPCIAGPRAQDGCTSQCCRTAVHSVNALSLLPSQPGPSSASLPTGVARIPSWKQRRCCNFTPSWPCAGSSTRRAPSVAVALAAAGTFSAAGGAELVFAVLRKCSCYKQGARKARLAFPSLFLISGPEHGQYSALLSKAP